MPMTRPASRLAVLLACLTIALAACGGASTDATDTATDSAAPPTSSPSVTADATESAEPTESEAATDDASSGTEVVLGDMSYSPGELTVAAGTTVTFTNPSSFPHTITHGTGGRPADDAAFDEAISPDGGTVEITFDEPGTYDITCKLHPSMQMRVVVEG
jgi:plastocyanin